MVIICSAAYCKSNSKTLINGEKVHFFSYPTDPKLREAWDKATNARGITSASKLTKVTSAKVLCHLHFSKTSFESINKLKPDAVPMLTYRLKRKAEEANLQSCDVQIKRTVLSLPVVNNEPKMNSEETSIQTDGSSDAKLQPYRLIIQIEKILQRPCPKSKKISQSKTNGTIGNGLLDHSSKDQHVFVKSENQFLCLVCKESFDSTVELRTHLKNHFTCDICGMEFSSQKSHKNHYEIHQSKNERYPYKCHVCSALFEKKDYIKTHNHIKNMGKFETADENRIQYCKSCHMSFRDEPTFRKHLNSHVESAVMNHLTEPLAV